MIPRREPKYEIIVEKEEKVTVIEDVNVPTVDREQVENKEAQGNVKKRKKLSKQKSEKRKQRQRIGLLGAGTTPAARAEVLTVFTILAQLFFV